MQRNISLDVLKLIMAVMIIALHAGFLSEDSALASYLTVQGVFRIVVPIFLLINGFFFFSVIAKRSAVAWFKRIAILYCVWMGFYSLYWFELPDYSLQSWLTLLETVIFGYYHLWYVSGMFMGAGLLYCLRHSSTACLSVCLVSTFLLGVFVQYAANYHWFDSVFMNDIFAFAPLHRGPLLLSFPFLALGFLLHRHRWHERLSLSFSVMLCILGLVALLAESYGNFVLTRGAKGFDNFLSLILVCPAIFLLFMKINIQGQGKSIALYSSSIYFVHLVFLNSLRAHTELSGMSLILATLILALAASYCLVKLNRRIKYIL